MSNNLIYLLLLNSASIILSEHSGNYPVPWPEYDVNTFILIPNEAFVSLRNAMSLTYIVSISLGVLVCWTPTRTSSRLYSEHFKASLPIVPNPSMFFS